MIEAETSLPRSVRSEEGWVASSVHSVFLGSIGNNEESFIVCLLSRMSTSRSPFLWGRKILWHGDT
ncbi:hypothetical protein A2635_02165 [Candidatus Peribacteria bacterium RIFCSPHIGHO2_01_FULL_51_9]|nr:MAG: hypothetical protein A2635_02165 [Candidatus Peribacteria bacterium RIFCSPHIGHO2_01_FULL_51_9]